MTLVVGVLTGDGVVFAADSRTMRTVPGKPSRVASDFTHKVFKVGDCAVATSGWAYVLDRNIAAHMAEFVNTFEEEEATPESISTALGIFFAERVEEHFAAGKDLRIGPNEECILFGIAGYNGSTGETWELRIPSQKLRKIYTTQTGGVIWMGQTDVVGRILKGIDPRLAGLLGGDATLSAALAQIQPQIDGLEYLYPPLQMNIQDAIDFATFLIRTTIDVQRLTNGIISDPGSFPSVGGPIEIALVTSSGGFEWVQRTSLVGERSSGMVARE